ncbi:hypothetical protein C1645_824568 [Glomus cerebriforme]|uniref:Uncharacterized protein n=1 Tax=Glomus cerebriforme TaxID=658196 RepID=A0A397T0Q7_9GLOM|nr:hypothetical protein C1645_824568 [Glomus cerebriforme]
MLHNIECHDITPFSKQDSMVLNNLILKACIYCHFNGPGGSPMKKPSFTHKRLPSEKLQEFEKFINDKIHVVISSYKTDSKTSISIKYLCDNKQVFWEKFHAEFSNGIYHTTFMTKLQRNEYIYQEDLSGLYSTCSTCMLKKQKQNFLKKLNIHIYDHWLMNACQDSWFTASLLHTIIESLENKPKKLVGMVSNKCKEMSIPEAKITIDSHYAQISYAIKHQVYLGLDIMEGADIEVTIKNIYRTSIVHLEPN